MEQESRTENLVEIANYCLRMLGSVADSQGCYQQTQNEEGLSTSLLVNNEHSGDILLLHVLMKLSKERQDT